jgi:hypothetical protein
MNLTEAFIEVKYLDTRIDSMWNALKTHNSVLSGKSRPYDMRRLYKEISELITQRTELRKKIATSCVIIRPLKIEIEEIKKKLKNLNTVICHHGPHKALFDRVVNNMEADFKANEIEELKVELENQLKERELKLSSLYHKTQIE